MKVGLDFVVFIVAAAIGRFSKQVNPSIPTTQADAARKYKDAVDRGTGEQSARLQALLLTVFNHKICESATVLPGYRFLVFYSFRRDGGLDVCKNITQIISKLVFLGRATIFNGSMALVHAPDTCFLE